MSAAENSGGSPKRRGRPWPKGVSGNPGGRPSTPKEVADYIGAHTMEAAERLVEIMRGRDPQQARLAAEALLDRRLGRPSQSMTVEARSLTAVPEEFALGAATLLDKAIEAAEAAEAAGATDTATVALPEIPESSPAVGADDEDVSPAVVPPDDGETP